MDKRPDPVRVYEHAVRAGDRRLASLIAGRIFRGRSSPSVDCEQPPLGALESLRRLREHLGI